MSTSVETTQDSDVTTEPESKAPKAPTTLSIPRGFLAKLTPVLSEMVELEDAAERATTALGFKRVAVGGFLGELSVLWLGKGFAAEAVQTRILGIVKTATQRDYEWESVNEWIASAATEATLPESLHGVFTVEGLRILNRVPAKPTKDGASDERIDFARMLQDKGLTSNRAVRAANKERTAANGKGKGKSEVVPATVAGKIIPDVLQGAKTIRRILAKRGVTPTEAQQIALYCGSVSSLAKGDSEVYSIVFADVLSAKRDAPKPKRK